jgi:hypothetical protein
MNKLLKNTMLICVSLFVLTGQVIADSLSSANKEYDAGNYAIAAELFIPLAQQGNVLAQLRLGAIYESGKGVAQDYNEAAKWYRFAAMQGSTDAQVILAGMLLVGSGVLQDYKEAERLIRLAVEKGDGNAQCVLGVMYYSGKGVPKDIVLAYMWESIAVSNLGVTQRSGDALSLQEIKSIEKKEQRVSPEDMNTLLLKASKQYAEYSQKTIASREVVDKESEDVGTSLLHIVGMPTIAEVRLHKYSTEAEAALRQVDEINSVSNTLTSQPLLGANVDAATQQRDLIAKSMTAQQIAEAKELARKCTANEYKGC